MLSIIKPIVPNLLPVLNGDTTLTTAWLAVLAFAGLSALILSRYSSERYKTNRTKTAIFFVAFALLMSVLMLCFFGCSATTVKGIVFFLVLLQSSFEDVRVRECDDCLHILILVAAFIGTGFSSLIGMEKEVTQINSMQTELNSAKGHLKNIGRLLIGRQAKDAAQGKADKGILFRFGKLIDKIGKGFGSLSQKAMDKADKIRVTHVRESVKNELDSLKAIKTEPIKATPAKERG